MASSECEREPAADMDARELAPQLLFFVEAGVHEGSRRFQVLSTTSYGTVRFPGLGAKLTAGKLQQLADLRLTWAAGERDA